LKIQELVPKKKKANSLKEKKAALYGIEHTIPIALPYIHPWIMVPSWSLHKSQLFTIEGEISL